MFVIKFRRVYSVVLVFCIFLTSTAINFSSFKVFSNSVGDYQKGLPGTFFGLIDSDYNNAANPATGEIVKVSEKNTDGSYKKDTNGNPIIYAKDLSGNQNIIETFAIDYTKLGLEKFYSKSCIKSDQIDIIKASAQTAMVWLSNQPVGKRQIALRVFTWINEDSNIMWGKEKTMKVMADSLELFFKELATINGQVDVVTMDWEWFGPGMGFWDTKLENKNEWLGLENDPRFEKDIKPKLENLNWETKVAEPYMYYMYDGEADFAKREKNSAIWSKVNAQIQAEVCNKTYYYPIKKYYPDITFLNYAHASKNDDYKTIDLSGYYPGAIGQTEVIGNRSAPDLYGWLWQAQVRPPEGLDSYEKTPFHGFLQNQNYMRQATLSNTGVPVTPYISQPRFDYFQAEGGTFANAEYGQNNYYYENLLHIGLNSPEYFMCWIPAQSTWNKFAYDWSSQEDILNISKTFRELDELVGFKDRASLNSEMVSYSTNYVLSGMSANNNNVWRLTPDMLKGAITRTQYIAEQEKTTPFTKAVRDAYELSLANVFKGKYYWIETGANLIIRYKKAIGWYEPLSGGEPKDTINGSNKPYLYEIYLKNSYFDAQYQDYLKSVLNSFKITSGNLNPKFKIGNEEIVFPDGSYIYTPSESTNATYGFWVISPKGTTPVASGKSIQLNKDAYNVLNATNSEKKSSNVLFNQGIATNVGNKDYIEMKNIDFGAGTNKAVINLNATAIGGTIELRLDLEGDNVYGKPYGTIIGSKNITASGNQALSIDLYKTVSGKHHLVVIYRTDGTDKIGISSIQFEKAVSPVIPSAFGPDLLAPTWSNKNATAIEISNNGAKIQWSGATDNHIVEGYNIYDVSNGGKTLIAEVLRVLNSSKINYLQPGCSYNIKVEAFDRGGKETTDGPEVTFTTLGTKDTAKPIWQIAVSKDIRPTVAFLSWSAPTDTSSIKNYNIYKSGTKIATLDGTVRSYQVTGLSPSTAYDVKIDAVDVAGNVSDQQDVSFTTTAGSLIGSWKLSDSDGTSSVTDLSGRNNSGTVVNASKFSDALVLNGGYVDFGNKPEFNPGNQGFTASIWFRRVNANLVTGYIVGKGNYNLGTGWAIRMKSDNFLITYNNGDDRCFTATLVAPITSTDVTNWHNLTLVIDRNDNIIKGYFDGVYNASNWDTKTESSTINYGNSFGTQLASENTYGMMVGAARNSLNAPADFAAGLYDNLKLYNYSLSSSEILTIYNNTRPTVGADIKPTSVSLDRTAVDLKKGQSDKLTATILPSNASNKGVTWTTDAPSYVSVDASGNIKSLTNVPVVSVSLKQYSYMNVGGTETLTAVTNPVNATNQNMRWESDNPAVATVDAATGKVTAVGIGTANVYAYSQDGNIRSVSGCNVNVVSNTTAVAKIDIQKNGTNITATSIPVGYSEVIRAKPTWNSTNQNVTWLSSNTAVATVDEFGRVTAIKAGSSTITVKSVSNAAITNTITVTVTDNATAVITATSKGDTTKKATCTVSVKPSEVYLNKFSTSIAAGSTETLIATATGSVTWTSNEPTVATVDNNGLVTAIKAGVTTISAKVGTTTFNCTVTVILTPKKATQITISPVTPIVHSSNDITLTDKYVGPRHHDFFTVTTTSSTDLTKLNKMTATLYPLDATSKIYWKSYNINSVIIDEKTGVFKSLKPGVARIRAIIVDEDASLTEVQNKTNLNNVYTEYLVTVLPENSTQHTVTFNGKDGAKITDVLVFDGMAATAPTPPVIPGWKFIGWDKTFDNITTDIIVNAIYEQIVIPIKPNAPTLVSKTATTINISWTAVEKADSYNVYVNGSKSNLTSITGIEYSITGLTKATAYTIKITAVNAAGESAASDEIIVITLNVMKGDVNGDGEPTIADAMKIFQSLSGKIPELVGPEKEAADINGDGEVTIADAMRLFQWLSGKIPTL